MDFFNTLFKKKTSDAILVVGNESEDATIKKEKNFSLIFHYFSFGMLAAAIMFSWYSTGDLVFSYEIKLRQAAEIAEQKKTEQKNLEALSSLSKQIDNIKKQKDAVESAVPSSPNHDQIVRFLEYEVFKLQKKYSVELPDHISWTPVPENDVANPDFSAVSIDEYSFPFLGEYEAFLEFLSDLRFSARLLDLRSVKSFQRKLNGLVAADLTVWGYHLPQ